MSSSSTSSPAGTDINDRPNHFIVLDAISKGIKSPDKIAKATKLGKDEVETIVNDLTTQRLALRVEKKGLLGRKKSELAITDTGDKLLAAKKQELEEKWQKFQQCYNNGDKEQLQDYMDANRAWIPMMLFSGIMNAMFFSSMMSFIGMAMFPMEGAMLGDNSGAGSDMQQVSDGGADAGTGGADMGSGFDTGGGDFSF
jgi:hypothetical protein